MLTPARVTLAMLVAVGGLVTAYVAKTLLATEAPPPVATRTVPMALTDLEPGTLITEAHVGPGYIHGPLPPDVLINDKVIIGRVVKERVPAATPIRSGYLYPPGDRPALPVTEGMRAVSVAVEGSPAMVDGLIKPGQHVDVHLSPEMRDDPRFGGGMTFTLLRGVKVLAINRSQQPGGADRGGNTVTLELTPEQSNVILLARNTGSLALTYNPTATNTGDVVQPAEEGATLNEILNLPPLPQPVISEHYRGSARMTQEIRNGRTTALTPLPTPPAGNPPANDRPEPTAAKPAPRT